MAANRKKHLEEQDIKILNGSYRIDVNGDPKFNPMVTLDMMEKQAELKALKEKQDQDQQAVRAEQ